VADEAMERIGDDHRHRGLDGGAFTWGFLSLIKVVGLGYCGRLSEATTVLEALARLAHTSPHPYNDIQFHTAASFLGLRRGDTANAVAHARQLVTATERVDSLVSRSLGRMTLGFALEQHGELDHAADALSEVLASAEERGIARFWVFGALAGLGDVRLRQRDFAAARAIAEDILVRTKDIPATLARTQSYLVLARCDLRSGPDWSAERIEDWLSEAGRQARLTGHMMLEPDILECRAELAAARGDDAGRVAYLRESLRLYTSVGAEGHAVRVGRSLATA
jgi:hypothetical protein